MLLNPRRFRRQYDVGSLQLNTTGSAPTSLRNASCVVAQREWVSIERIIDVDGQRRVVRGGGAPAGVTIAVAIFSSNSGTAAADHDAAAARSSK